ncbi:hypothetical protein IJK16_01180 [Candidatus Saccharibacteria bacterium]|nr:hypothetical protein [Candidatus Saccharibacteria bacterium]
MKKIKMLLGLVFAIALIPIVNVSAADEDVWGPQSRETFTWKVPSSYRTFNSITDNPDIGDERNFVRVKEFGKSGPHLDNATIEVGKTYEVYVYYHNGASADLNSSGKGIANNVRLKIDMPSELKAGQAAKIKGTISATNTTPTSVWDTAYLTANDTVYLRYVQNSAVIHNGGSANGSVLDGNALFGEGAKLGHWSNQWGIIPACNEYAGYVTFRVVADQPKFYITKEVSTDGGNTWSETATAEPGQELMFKITYNNIGTTEQKGVTVRDSLALTDGLLDYVLGSTNVKIPANADYVASPDKLFTEDGLVIGNFTAGQTSSIIYKVKVADDIDKFICGATVLYNGASVATANGTMYDKAKITINRTCDTPEEMPETGPAEIILAVVIALGIGAGGVYYWQSRRMVKVLEDNSLGLHKNDKV